MAGGGKIHVPVRAERGIHLKGNKMKNSPGDILFCSALMIFAGSVTLGASVARGGNPTAQIPTCDKKIGTLAVTEPQNQWWTALNLESPAALIRSSSRSRSVHLG